MRLRVLPVPVCRVAHGSSEPGKWRKFRNPGLAGLRGLCRGLWLVLVCLLAVRTGQASEPEFWPDRVSRLTVTLADGRQVTGGIDGAYDPERLWLKTVSPGITVRSGHRWELVQSVVQNSRQFTADEFQNLIRSQSVTQPVRATSEKMIVVIGPEPEEPAESSGGGQKEPVRSLHVRARVMSWDADPEPDGVVIEVMPLDGFGRLVPVTGQLTANLIGEPSAPAIPVSWNRPGPSGFQRPASHGLSLARWSGMVRSDDFVDGPARYQVPFTTRPAGFRSDLFSQAVLTASLGVSGVGRFQASDDAVWLVAPSAIRDRLQQLSGRRYFGDEATRVGW